MKNNPYNYFESKNIIFYLNYLLMTNPIIQAYIETDEKLLTVLEKHANKNQYLELVFLDMISTLRTNKILNHKIIVEIDLAIIRGHPDSNVFTLFVSSAIIELYNLKEFEKVKSLYSIAISTISDLIHPVIQAAWCQAKAKFLLIKSDYSAVIQLVNTSLLKIENKPWRYLSLALIAPSNLAIMGLLNEIKELDSILKCSAANKTHIFSIIELKLVNSIIIGNTKLGFELIESYKKNFTRENSFKEFALNELNMLSNNFNQTNYLQEAYKILMNIYSDLLDCQFHSAKKNYQKLKAINWDNFLAWNFVDYIPIHIEICLGSIGKARLLLKEKIDLGKVFYLDDLFYGRLFLLEKNDEAAGNAFTRLIKNINQYGAMGRLVFELQFAKDMKLSDILLLTQGWQINKKSATNQKTKKYFVEPPHVSSGIETLIGSSKQIKNVKELIKKYSLIKAPILITGETGTGKELVARAIHDEGEFSKEPFIAINCGALTESLLQSELYGYVAGAFTGAQKERKGIFESAGEGTVFLDEFGDISSQLQISLLRVLESNEIRMIGGVNTRLIKCKVVIATNVDLLQLVQEKKFRKDLYFRLTRFEIKLPALIERKDDIPILISHFINLNCKGNEPAKVISKELLQTLLDYEWPGNVRELKNEMERLYILHSDKNILGKEDFDFTHLKQWSFSKEEPFNYPVSLNEPQRLINKELARSNQEEYLEIINERLPQFEKRQLILKEVFLANKKLTRHQVMGITKTSPATASKDLKELCKTGFIIRRSPTKSTRSYYFELVD